MTIYFLGANDRVKIGFTDGHAQQRLSQLQTGSAYPLRLLGQILGASMKEEQRLHFCFSEFRIPDAPREWFYLTQKIDDFITKFAEPTTETACAPVDAETPEEGPEPKVPSIRSRQLDRTESSWLSSLISNFVFDMFTLHHLDEDPLCVDDILKAWHLYNKDPGLIPPNETYSGEQIAKEFSRRLIKDFGVNYSPYHQDPNWKVMKFFGIKFRDRARSGRTFVDEVLKKL